MRALNRGITAPLPRAVVLIATLVCLNFLSWLVSFRPQLWLQRREEEEKDLLFISSSYKFSSQDNEQQAMFPVDFLTMQDEDLIHDDIFSASWWQRTDRFLEVELSRITNVEGDAFVPIIWAGNGREDVVKTRDYLDFGLEHLSKWWKHTETAGMLYAERKLNDYVERNRGILQDTLLNTTLAIIPYGVSDQETLETQQVWKASLTATIASLLRHGIARIVVVGHYPTDARLTARAFSELSGQPLPVSTNSQRPFETRVGATELAYVHTDNVNSTFIRINVPRGALVDLQDALAGRMAVPTPYLGSSEQRYDYIFLTEADQILQARLTSDFLHQLDAGLVLVPHRLQPIPHIADVHAGAFAITEKSYVRQLPPTDHKPLYYLDSAVDACCDTGRRIFNHGQTCGDFWWECGLFSEEWNHPANFTHLEPYRFMSLLDGTGIVSLAATEQSRRCQPVPNGRGTCMSLSDRE